MLMLQKLRLRLLKRIQEEVISEVTTEEAEEESGIQVLKKKFIEGGAGFMSLPLNLFNSWVSYCY